MIDAGTVAAAAAPTRAPLPRAQPFVAPPQWQAIDFISDLHVSESTPDTVGALEAHLAHTPADAVFILGDLFELWVGDDARATPFGRRCLQLLHPRGRRCRLGVMVGNRDFLVGRELLRDCDAIALPDPTRLDAWGQVLLLSHGDALCLADAPYQAFRAQVREPAWQQDFLARPLAERQRIAAEIRRAAGSRRRFDGDLTIDIDRAEALRLLDENAATALVHGHTHRPGSQELAPGIWRHVLSDWDLDGAAPRSEVLRLTRAGLRRLPRCSC
jgi:UDP-2,3-diacylglucosamine hydrolase